MRSDIDKDVVTLLDRYSIDSIMGKMIEYLNDKDVVKLKQWCKDMGIQTDTIGDSLDKTIMRGMQTELDTLNARVGRIERTVENNHDDYGTKY